MYYLQQINIRTNNIIMFAGKLTTVNTNVFWMLVIIDTPSWIWAILNISFSSSTVNILHTYLSTPITEVWTTNYLWITRNNKQINYISNGTSLSPSQIIHLWLITWFIARVIRRVPLVEYDIAYPFTSHVFRLLVTLEFLNLCLFYLVFSLSFFFNLFIIFLLDYLAFELRLLITPLVSSIFPYGEFL